MSLDLGFGRSPKELECLSGIKLVDGRNKEVVKSQEKIEKVARSEEKNKDVKVVGISIDDGIRKYQEIIRLGQPKSSGKASVGLYDEVRGRIRASRSDSAKGEYSDYFSQSRGKVLSHSINEVEEKVA